MRNPDKRLRDLEREAKSGDDASAYRLLQELLRREQVPDRWLLEWVGDRKRGPEPWAPVTRDDLERLATLRWEQVITRPAGQEWEGRVRLATQPGKYSSPLGLYLWEDLLDGVLAADYVRDVVLVDTEAQPRSEGVNYNLILLDPGSAADYVRDVLLVEHPDVTEREAGLVLESPGIILVEDSDGFVEASVFDDEDELHQAWAAIEEEPETGYWE